MISQRTIDKGCDVCMEPFSDVVYDAKTKHGPWAFMCQACFDKIGPKKLGVGLGQKYSTTTREKLEG